MDKQINQYPEYIMQKLRGRRGLESDDTSEDEKINKMSPEEAFEEVLVWEFGYPGWSRRIAEWIRGTGADVTKIE